MRMSTLLRAMDAYQAGTLKPWPEQVQAKPAQPAQPAKPAKPAKK